jgi:hypothetical protein
MISKGYLVKTDINRIIDQTHRVLLVISEPYQDSPHWMGNAVDVLCQSGEVTTFYISALKVISEG